MGREGRKEGGGGHKGDARAIKEEELVELGGGGYSEGEHWGWNQQRAVGSNVENWCCKISQSAVG